MPFRSVALFAPALVAALACGRSAHAQIAVTSSGPGTEVRYPVRDSLDLVADIYRGTGGPAAPTMILFPQGGGSARGEYRLIVPRLLAEGWNVVAADVRGGGDRFGAPSRAPAVGEGFSYCDAIAEVEAAVGLARARGFGGPLVLWGSSYTAALALQAAARRSADVDGVLAFSPASGEPMAGCEPAPWIGWLARAGVPTLVLRPRVELADSTRAAALEAMRRDGAAVFVAERGVHGSSMLDSTRTNASTEPQWTAVLQFIRGALGPRAVAAGERPVSILSDGGWLLRGDLRLPAQTPAPIVILLHKAAGDRAVYRELAQRLAAAGIGSLRVDLRGHGESVNQGRFVPGQPFALEGTERDIVAIWRFVRLTAGVDTTRLAMVSGSYSSEAAAIAGREAGFGRAQVALSPGDFSDESFRAAAASGSAWLFVRSDKERFVGKGLDAKVKALAPGAELWVIPAGAAHASDLLLADPTLAGRLTAWLRQRLGS